MFLKIVAVKFLFVVVALGTPLPEQSDVAALNMQRKFEEGGFFEGDMRFPEGDGNWRNGLVNTRYRWINKTVYYDISPEFTTAQKQVITGGLDEIQRNTCIQFKQRTNQTNYVYVQRENSGCWSYVGMIGGKQLLNLQVPGCLYHRTAMHEFMHALGFHHQHSSTDRDDYIEVHLENVSDEYQYAYDKYGPDRITDFGIAYDYKSVLHYNQYAFSKNGKKTITTKDPSMQNIVGTITSLSTKDIAKMRAMYNC